MGKPQEPNYQMLLDSAICALQQAYKEYKKAIIKDLDFTWINNKGEYSFVEGVEERVNKINELGKEVVRLQFKVNELKELVEVKQNAE